jgi:hypothetical protein
MAFATDSFERLFGATDGISVTPSDSVDLSIGFCRGILVGVSGALSVVTTSGTTVTFPTVVAGVIHPICATRIRATGTSATGIVAVK